jgi:hypothetical protein
LGKHRVSAQRIVYQKCVPVLSKTQHIDMPNVQM